MKDNYTITSAKAQAIRCGLRFEGKKIVGRQPGIKGLGAVDFLLTKGYSYYPEIPEVIKDKILSSMRGKI